jgi:hypothetical protein
MSLELGNAFAGFVDAVRALRRKIGDEDHAWETTATSTPQRH